MHVLAGAPRAVPPRAPQRHAYAGEGATRAGWRRWPCWGGRASGERECYRCGRSGHIRKGCRAPQVRAACQNPTPPTHVDHFLSVSVCVHRRTRQFAQGRAGGKTVDIVSAFEAYGEYVSGTEAYGEPYWDG